MTIATVTLPDGSELRYALAHSTGATYWGLDGPENNDRVFALLGMKKKAKFAFCAKHYPEDWQPEYDDHWPAMYHPYPEEVRLKHAFLVMEKLTELGCKVDMQIDSKHIVVGKNLDKFFEL